MEIGALIFKKKKIELGGGENPRRKRQGYINVDRIKHKLVDKVCDFEKDKIPFSSGSVEAIFCSHCLEHIENVRHFLNECYRVLCKGGRARFIVPYGLHSGSCKPVHKQIITPSWFDFLRRDNAFRTYGFKVWGIEKIDEIKNKNGEVYELDVILIK
jgi:predicted SAM-dependent methyltransferase